MYLYFDKSGKISTVIPHGEPARQGSPLKLYVCFDYDFFTSKGLNKENIDVYIQLAKPGQAAGTPISPITEPNLSFFEKTFFSEVTYNLIPGKRYHTYYFNVLANESTIIPGKLKTSLFLADKATTLNENGKEDKNIYYQASTEIFVEKTFGVVQTATIEQINEENIINNLIEPYGLRITNLEGTRKFFRGPILPIDKHDPDDIFLITSGENKGNIYKAISTEDSLTWELIVYGKDWIDALETRIGQNEEDIATIKTNINEIEKDIKEILDGSQSVGKAKDFDTTTGTIKENFEKIYDGTNKVGNAEKAETAKNYNTTEGNIKDKFNVIDSSISAIDKRVIDSEKDIDDINTKIDETLSGIFIINYEEEV